MPTSTRCHHGLLIAGLLLAAFQTTRVNANPQGGTVSQGAATFSTSGSQLTVTTSAQTFINWSSFNIGAGETTTFVQPSSSSVVWNHINDPNASQILGTLDANGYVVLQNSSGFYVGGQAAINTHGLLMTTAPIPMPSLSGGGAWQFDALPPSARIINYGQINIAGGAPAFLIASDIQNNGTISNPGGKIGLYAGEKVLVSTSPDGRGVSAEVTLPQGSVNNNGQLIADAGSIVMQAQVVNQGGLVQANSVRDVNGAIELTASDSLNLGANSVISARGDRQGVSAGGHVTLKSGNTFSDQVGSIIDISGGAQGGNGGEVEVSASQMDNFQSTIHGAAGAGFSGGKLTIDPTDILLDSAFVSSLNSQIAGGLSQVDVQADNDIELSTTWTLADQAAPAALTLSAGNNITFDNGSAIRAGKNWNLSLSAGTALAAGATPLPGSDGIYLDGNALIQSANGNINLWAANEVQVGWTGQSSGEGVANPGIGRITTTGGGSIEVTALYGDVNTGGNTSGFNYLKNAPFYTPFTVNPFTGVIGTTTTLGGISTAAGGNVSISAGGDVTSYYPTGSSGKSTAAADPGTGAFGSQAGNVTITAGGNVFGHYVMMNGVGNITAGMDAGNAGQNISLSGASSSWNVNAARDIYLQEVRNPNGVFNVQGGSSSDAYHFFDYNPLASLSLTAGDGVYLTGQNIPRPNDNVPILLPPSLSISAGAGGVTLENNMTLFPSPDGDLSIVTRSGSGGDFLAENSSSLVMSDSAQTHWFVSNTGTQPFSPSDHASTPPELNNSDPVIIDIDGNMENVILQTTKQTEITVGGDMVNSSFSGQNLHPGDVTSIHVTGDIYNSGSFNWVFLQRAIPNVPIADLPPGAVNNWETALALAVDPAKIAGLTIPAGTDPSQFASYVNQVLLFGNSLQSSFAYNSSSKRLTFVGTMSSAVQTALEQPTLTVLRYDANGQPLVVNGHFVTDQISWVPANAIQALYQASQGAPPIQDSGGGLVLGGTGTFDISARSISLGNSYGIISLGNGALLGRDYSSLTPYINSGATIDVTVDQDVTENGATVPSLNMPSSTIAALGGGDVNVNSLHGSMDLGSSELVDFESQIMKSDNLGLGIYTTSGGAVNVTALGDIDVDSSRIATFNGGNILVESYQGNVNAGSGGAVAIPVNVFSPTYQNPKTPFEYVYANGIVAETLVNPAAVPGAAAIPGDITVLTPQGDIVASVGGILQQSFDVNAASFPSTITLQAGTPGAGGFGSSDTPLYVGNIDVDPAGVIGINLKVQATGTIKGLLIGKNQVNIIGAIGPVVVIGKTVDVHADPGSGGEGPAPVIIGTDKVSYNGSDPVTLISPNATANGGQSQSTVAPVTATSASQSAAQQSSSDATETVASNGDDDDKRKKGKKAQPLLKRVKRVTVLLPKES